MKTFDTVNPRIPAPWQSAQGEAEPKARPQRRSRWIAGEHSCPAVQALLPQKGPCNEGKAALWMAVQPRRRKPRRECEDAGQPNSKFPRVDRQEKLQLGVQVCVRTVNRHRWVRRAASGERVKQGQGTRHNDPVTSEEGMPFMVPLFTDGAVGGRR